LYCGLINSIPDTLHIKYAVNVENEKIDVIVMNEFRIANIMIILYLQIKFYIVLKISIVDNIFLNMLSNYFSFNAYLAPGICQ
jgi:hypothetical protein